MKEITAEMIDPDLVIRIARDIEFTFTERVAIREVLAWLANHPILPTMEQTKHIYGYEGQYEKLDLGDHQDPTMASAVMEFQRIAYLKKEPTYPVEVTRITNQLLKDSTIGIGDAVKVHDAINEAYKLGKESGGEGC